jgi:DNA-binding Xre family transcriptional regulator
MAMINTISEFAQQRGCKNAYEFWKITGLSQATAYQLYSDRTAYPSKDNQNAICRAFNAQPGEFLRYIPDADSEDESI